MRKKKNLFKTVKIEIFNLKNNPRATSQIAYKCSKQACGIFTTMSSTMGKSSQIISTADQKYKDKRKQAC